MARKWTPSDELFSSRLEESVRRYGVSGTADRYGVNRSTIYRWRTDRANQRVTPRAASKRYVVRATLSDRRKRMYEGLVSKKRASLQEDIKNAPSKAQKKAAEGRLRAFEKSVKSGEFGKAFKQQLAAAKSSEDWKKVRASYRTLTRSRIGTAEFTEGA